MVEIRGFSGLRFDTDKTGSPDAVLTPPYDVIDPDERGRLASLSPYNMTHLILPEGEAGACAYENAAQLFRSWIAEGVLHSDPESSLYLLRQHFTGPDGKVFVRRAFFAVMKLPESGENYILGHERTFNKPVEDRLALLRAVQANLEPIFVMYSDPENSVLPRLFAPMEKEPPLLSAKTSDGVEQELWRISCPEYLMQHFQDQTLYIADGHHRFKTACDRRDECRKDGKEGDGLQPFDYIMAGFVAFEEPGLKIYAAHRVVPQSVTIDFEKCMERIRDYFECRELSSDVTEKDLAQAKEDDCVFIMASQKQGTWLLTLKEEKRKALLNSDRGASWQALDVAILHRGILDQLLGVPDDVQLIYEKDAQTAVSLVSNGTASIAFLLRPTSSEQVRDCAEALEPMPQKSTYFFPKLPTGTVIYPLF